MPLKSLLSLSSTVVARYGILDHRHISVILKRSLAMRTKTVFYVNLAEMTTIQIACEEAVAILPFSNIFDIDGVNESNLCGFRMLWNLSYQATYKE